MFNLLLLGTVRKHTQEYLDMVSDDYMDNWTCMIIALKSVKMLQNVLGDVTYYDYVDSVSAYIQQLHRVGIVIGYVTIYANLHFANTYVKM